MSEAFDLAETMQPNSIAISADLSGDAGLGMFLHLIESISVGIVMYGSTACNRTPTNFENSVSFVELTDQDGVTKLVQTVKTLLPADDVPMVSGPRTSDSRGKTIQPALIVMGASTGGVSALETVLTAFPADCPPTLVVQHIRPGFIDGMIRRLDQRCSPDVCAAAEAMCPRPGLILVAADTERHLVLQGVEAMRCRLKATAPRHGHRPSVDALFESAAGRPGVAAALLTGMGADGADGMAKIKSAGGLTIAQDEATCVVYGMPRVAVELGAASLVLPLQQIASALLGQLAPIVPKHRAESVK